MNIPLWLLKLLPMWEHICPKCRKIVKANSHQCPHCGEKYGCPLRIPPTFLHDKKKLEAYVHKYIFPRVSRFERAYLAQFFTTFFSDGFESGSFSAWSGTTVSSGCTLEVIAAAAYTGSYGMHYLIQSGWESAYCYENFTPDSEQTNVRLYAQCVTLPSSGGLFEIAEMGCPGSSGYIWRLWWASDGYVHFQHVTNTGDQDIGSYVGTGVWVCIEVQFYYDSNAGYYEVYINGSQVLDYGTFNTTANGNCNQIRIGADGWSAGEGYIDDVVVADTYIGLLSSTTNLNVSDSSSGSDAVGVSVSLPVADSGLGSDMLVLQANVPISDSGQGLDSIGNLQVQILLGDSGLSSDSVTVGNTISLSDLGEGSDSVTIKAQIALADMGEGQDAVSLILTTVISDVGVGSGSLIVATPISVSDEGLGADSVIVIAAGAFPTHEIIIQGGTGKVVLQTENGTVTLQSDSD